jgi:D-lactate dehydrogenase (cytochrome)
VPQAGNTGLVGGQVPMHGELLLSVGRLKGVRAVDAAGYTMTVETGLTLAEVQAVAEKANRLFPLSLPSEGSCQLGGNLGTNAGGVGVLAYGNTRQLVLGLEVVLADGRIWNGLKALKKDNTGYDLRDLFIGSEGTLGVIAQVIFRTAVKPGAVCRALVPVPTEAVAIAVTGELRAQSQDTWRSRDPRGIDVAAIEHIDARSIAVIREDGIDRRLDVTLAGEVALLIDLELPAGDSSLWSQLESVRDPDAPDTALLRFCRLLDRYGVLDDTEIALPSNRDRAAAFAELREAVPAGVNRRVAQAKQRDAAISKTAADMIVPFDRFDEMMAACRKLFADRDLDLAVWGHISDGNVHPNVIPRNADDVRKGREAILQLGTAVIAMGGCPLAEHGVGRNPIKQQLLRQLYGDEGIAAMRAIKLSLDPNGSLASGVIFPTQ